MFAASPSGDGKAERSDASAPRNFLLQKAKRKKTIGPDAGAASPPAGFGSAHAGLRNIDPKSRMRGPHVRFCERRGGVILRAYSTGQGAKLAGGDAHGAPLTARASGRREHESEGAAVGRRVCADRVDFSVS